MDFGIGGDVKENGLTFRKDVFIKLQQNFCRANHVYSQCFGADFIPIIPTVGTVEQQEFFIKAFNGPVSGRLFPLIEDNSVESVVEDDTVLPYLKLSAVIVRHLGKVVAFWAVYGVIEEYLNDDVQLPEGCYVVKEKDYYSSLALLETVLKEYVLKQDIEEHDIRKAEDESNRMEKLENELRFLSIMNNIHKENKGDVSFAELAGNIISQGANYLDVPYAVLLQRVRGINQIAEVAHFWKNDTNPLNSVTKDTNIENYPFFTGKTYIFSSDSILPDIFEAYFTKHSIRAAIFMPIEIGGGPNMYLMIAVPHISRKFSISDIQFASDMKRILQSSLVKKIRQNSLAGSFSALENLINKIDSAILVSDPETYNMLYMNNAYKKLSGESDINGGMRQLLSNKNVSDEDSHTEFFDVKSGKWFDVFVTRIVWVDGRNTILSVISEITEKKNYLQQVEKRANNDFLTGLYNRMRFEKDLTTTMAKAEELGSTGALIYLDLDDFKSVSEGMGHQYGDELLREISRALTLIDGIENSCYSMGTEQFSIIVNHINYPRLSDILLKIKRTFDRPWFLKNSEYYCYMNMGIALFPVNGRTKEDIMKKADIALFESKRHGRNGYEYYIEEMIQGGIRRSDLEKSILFAAKNNFSEFGVFYQPIFNLDGSISGAEALVRWNSRELGFVAPDSFIPMAEYLRLMSPIGSYVLVQALKACKQWVDAGRPEYKIHVNLSVTQLIESDILDQIQSSLNKVGLAPEHLVIEVTESLAVNDLDRMKKILGKIRDIGVLVALDDFGQGYSSLNYIREMPINMIKIDRSYISGISTDSFQQSFVKMVVELAGSMNISVCAEGVEYLEDEMVVKSLNVGKMQGYLFDKPLNFESFVKKYV